MSAAAFLTRVRLSTLIWPTRRYRVIHVWLSFQRLTMMARGMWV
jgi:hypothetical protein